MAPRKKPRTSHSINGCLTCKRRKVKCSEERPQCNRCILGKFICDGYTNPPTTWVFYNKKEAAVQPNRATIIRSGSLVTKIDQALSNSLTVQVHSPLKHGNSDPFNASAIPIGPPEHHLLQIYQTLFVPAFYNSRPARLASAIAGFEQETLIKCLQNEAAAYAVIARRAAVMDTLSLREHYMAPSVPTLAYIVKSQASLCNNLSLLNGSETPEMVHNTLCTISYLAIVDVLAASPTANVHIRALHQLITRYAKMADAQLLQRASMNIIAMFWMDAVKAYISSKRPTLHLEVWLPFLGEDMETIDSHDCLHSTDGRMNIDICHEAIEDEVLKALLIKQKQLNSRYNRSIEANQSPTEMLMISIALHREGLQINQLLHKIADVEDNLLDPGLSLKQMQRQCVHGCICLAVLLLSQATLPGSLCIDLIFDIAPHSLHRLKNIMVTGQLCGGLLELDKPFREARLWALAVAVHVELHRKEASGSYTTCGEWFLQTFRSEAKSMNVHSWQQAVNVFEQFLYTDQLKPQISDWWDRIMSD